MKIAVVLDSGPLGLVINTNSKNSEAVQCARWLQSLLQNNIRVCIPEISDYEVRRSLIKINSTKSLSKLDSLGMALNYIPINTPSMRKAANFWAQARNQGTPTAADNALDGDMVLVGQAHEIEQTIGAVIVATTNVKHINLFTTAKLWSDIKANDLG